MWVWRRIIRGLGVCCRLRKRIWGGGKKGVKAGSLSLEQKLFNKFLASGRVVVEYVNSLVKKFWVFGEEFRSRLKSYDRMADVVCGMVNFRISGTLIV
ncbi:MAG: transposase family protein [Nitrososphaerota archaeon]|jgi:hypothetical protein|nr:transposase family protein [Nitrososphaerota archaeon]